MILNLNIKPRVRNQNKTLSQIRSEQHRVFTKVEFTIKSCNTQDQLRVAENMCILFKRIYPYPPAFGRILMSEIDLRETIIRVKNMVGDEKS